jgi:hypothetical protein
MSKFAEANDVTARLCASLGAFPGVEVLTISVGARVHGGGIEYEGCCIHFEFRGTQADTDGFFGKLRLGMEVNQGSRLDVSSYLEKDGSVKTTAALTSLIRCSGALADRLDFIRTAPIGNVYGLVAGPHKQRKP